MEPFLQKLIKSAFWLAPILMLLSDTINLLGWEAGYWLASIAFWLSFYFFLLVIIGMVHLSQGSNFAIVAGLLAAAGTLIGITIIGTSRFAWGMEMMGTSEEVLMEVHMDPRIFFTSRFPGILFPVGLILLAISLKRHGVINGFLLVGLLVSIVLFPLGRIPGIYLFNVIGDVLMVVFFGGLLGRKLNSKHHLQQVQT
jgi:hypothetical protein